MIKKTTHTLQVQSSWNVLTHDVYEYTNNSWWEVIYLQAGLHGNELVGTPVLYELLDYIKTNKPKINLIIVPIANPLWLDSQIMGVQTGYNNIHTNEQNCFNYNRLWEGIGEPIEDMVVKTLFAYSKNASTIIDLHCAAHETALHIYTHKKYVDEAKQFCIPNLIVREDAGRAFEDTNVTLGKKSFTLELGPARSISDDLIQRWLNCLKNYLFAWWKLLDSYTSVEVDKWYLKKFFAPFAGFLTWHINVGDEFSNKQHIATIYTRDGKQKVHVPFDGKFLIKKPIHAPYLDQEIAQMIKY